jgi:hypothetical protein
MLEIRNTERFGKVIAGALSKIEQTTKDASTKKRWIRAIAKAVVEIEQNGSFMTWQEEENSLLIWSQRSNQIYSANGICQCRAFEEGSPCFHRAAARLVRLYMEPDAAAAVERSATAEEIPYLKPTVEIKAERIAGIRIN